MPKIGHSRTPNLTASSPIQRGLARTHSGMQSNGKACHRCSKQDSGPSNFLFTCTDCGKAWHHRCHVPPVSDEELVSRLNASIANDIDNGVFGWSCRRCLKNKEEAGGKGKGKGKAVDRGPPPQNLAQRTASPQRVEIDEDEPVLVSARPPAPEESHRESIDKPTGEHAGLQGSNLVSGRSKPNDARIPPRPPVPPQPSSSRDPPRPSGAQTSINASDFPSVPTAPRSHSGNPERVMPNAPLSAVADRSHKPPSHHPDAPHTTHGGFRQPLPPKPAQRARAPRFELTRGDSAQFRTQGGLKVQNRKIIPKALLRPLVSNSSQDALDSQRRPARPVSHERAGPSTTVPMDVDSDIPAPSFAQLSLNQGPQPSALPDFRAIASRLRAAGRLDP
ncbi:hypothetical protein EW146_g10196, partial [Bondarzewia mesenterica]